MEKTKNLFGKLVTRRVLLIAALACTAFLLLIMLFDEVVMPWYTKHGESLLVPNTLAQRYENAREVLKEAGLVAVKAGEKNDPNLPFGYVVEQNPPPNRPVKKGRRVYLTISVGEREVPAPALVGLSENNAIQSIKSVGLRLGEIDYEYVNNELPDVVISQSIEAKELLNVNSTIDIVVSLGRPKENVTVPRVLGKTLISAKRYLRKAGLVVGDISYRESENFLPNTILDQSIDAGTIVPFGEQVNLLVTVVNESDIPN